MLRPFSPGNLDLQLMMLACKHSASRAHAYQEGQLQSHSFAASVHQIPLCENPLGPACNSSLMQYVLISTAVGPGSCKTLHSNVTDMQ